MRFLLKRGIAEDCPHGDVTVKSLKLKSKRISFQIVAKQEGVVTGAWVWKLLSKQAPQKLQVKFMSDGYRARSGDWIVSGEGDWAFVMKWERTTLNIMAFLSAISTVTDRVVKRAQKTRSKIQISDTRKIIPGYRLLAKYAVHMGAGINHRMGLSDAILIKENHLRAVGGIKKACLKLLLGAKRNLNMEMELATLRDVKEFIESPKPKNLRWVLLDNFSPAQARKAVRMLRGYKIECSGGMNEKKLKSFVRLPIHRISLGALTHSAGNFDFSLQVIS